MNKQVQFGTDARTNLVKGIDTLADAVVSTLGPNGRNVVIEKGNGEPPQSTKDGVTVAKHIASSDPVENLGVDLVREASVKTADKAGDGTTTSTLLAREMIGNGLSHLALGENAVHLGLCLQFVERLKKDILDDFVFVKKEKSFGKEEKKGKKVKSA